MIPVYRPFLPPESLRYAQQALAGGWISSIGEYSERAEAVLAEHLGVRHVILVNSGTAAGHLLARCIRRFHPTIRRFIVPNNVFVAAWNALLYEWPASMLLAVDASPETWNADYDGDPSIGESGSDTCFMVVHNLGNTVNVPALQRRFPTSLFCEDACESIFGTYEGKAVGTQSFASTLSFFGNKNITCGEGGAVLTNSDEVAAAVRCMKGQGQAAVRYLHPELGYNYRMTNIEAALLLGQLELWDEIQRRKVALFKAYAERFAANPRVALQIHEPDTEPSCWMFGLRIHGLRDYETARAIYAAAGIETRPMFFPIRSHGHLASVPGRQDVAEMLHRECVILPSWPELSEAEIDRVVAVTNCVCAVRG